MKPFLKWVGGKTQIIDDIISKFPKKIETYVEPFLGGGSVLFSLLNSEIEVNRIIACDANEELINCYVNIQKKCDSIIKYLDEICESYHDSEDKSKFYYEKRNEYNSMKKSCRKSALFIFLNKTCFRGLYRVGPNGFNVPFGNYKKPEIYSEKNIRKISEIIQNVEFRCCDFRELEYEFVSKDFIYLDPPYVPISKTSFVKYTKNSFNKKDHEELFEFIKGLKCKFLMSNSSCDYVLESFKDYRIKIIDCKRRINSKNPESIVKEVLVMKKQKIFFSKH